MVGAFGAGVQSAYGPPASCHPRLHQADIFPVVRGLRMVDDVQAHCIVVMVHGDIDELASGFLHGLRGPAAAGEEIDVQIFAKIERELGLVDGLGEIVVSESGHARPPDLFISAFAQADYMEVVNTEGLPYYAKLERLPFDKGVAGEAQSNPLHLCTRPLAVRELTL